jgi:hypothetical protein
LWEIKLQPVLHIVETYRAVPRTCRKQDPACGLIVSFGPHLLSQGALRPQPKVVWTKGQYRAVTSRDKIIEQLAACLYGRNTQHDPWRPSNLAWRSGGDDDEEVYGGGKAIQSRAWSHVKFSYHQFWFPPEMADNVYMLKNGLTRAGSQRGQGAGGKNQGLTRGAARYHLKP